MAGQRSLMAQEVVLSGHKFFGEMEEHTPPEVTKKTEDAKGGRAASKKIIVGYEVGNGSFKLKGATADALQEYGVEDDEKVQIDVTSSLQDEDAKKFKDKKSITCIIVSIKEGSESSQGVPELTIEYAPRVYKHTLDGKTLKDINLDTQYINLGKGDLMSAHRSNIGRS